MTTSPIPEGGGEQLNEVPDNVRELHPPAPTDLSDLEQELAGATRLTIGARAKLRAAGMAADAPLWLAWLIRKTPIWAWYAFRDFFVGLVRIAVASYLWLHMADERRTIDKMENRDAKARAKRDINKDNRFRLVVAGIACILVITIHLIVWFGWDAMYRYCIAVEAIITLIIVEIAGRRPRNTDEPIRKRGPLSHGTSSRTLRKDLEEAFAAKKVAEVGILGLTINKFGWHGSIETEHKLDESLIEHLERWVHAPPGSLMVTTNPRNSADHPFKLLIEDPLSGVVRPPEQIMGRDIRLPASLGRHLFGSPLRVNLMTHIGLVGRQRSGKSSGLWTIIDWISQCENARILGSIDIVGGPAFPVWRGVIPTRATTPEQAIELLDRAISEAKRRTDILESRAESDESDITDNWQPTRTDPALYLPIDELHALSDDKEVMSRIVRLARTSAKAAVYLILSTQRAGRDDFGLTALRAMVGLKILFSCESQDVTMMLGGKMLELGWRPTTLKPAQGDVPYDAGKAFVWDGDHQHPEVIRMTRLGIEDCRIRARKLTAPVAAPAPDSEEGLATALLNAAFAHYEQDRIPTRWLIEFLTASNSEWGIDRLQAALRAQGVTPSQIGEGPWGKNARGYKQR